MSIFSKWFSNKGADSEAKAEPKKPQLSAANYCEQGQKSLDAGKYIEAMEFFQAAIELDKHFEKAYLLLSEVYEKQGKFDKSRATLYALLALEPNNENALKKIEALKASNSTTTQSNLIPSQQKNNIVVINNEVPQHIPSNQTGNFKVFEGKQKDWFDYFIIFDDGNRLYFKCKGAGLEVVGPTENNWDGFIQPRGILQIPERITYDGLEMKVSSIGSHAFSLCREVKSAELPDTIEKIGSFAFSFCEQLAKINLPNSLNSIGSYAFSHCSSLQEIIIPEGIFEIKNETFSDCRNLKQITIPQSVRRIDMDAFGGFGYTNRQCVLHLQGMPPKLNWKDSYSASSTWKTLSMIIPKRYKDEYLMAQHWQLLKIVGEI